MRELRSGDMDAFMECLKVFFSSIPYKLNYKTERHYQTIFYVVLILLGRFIETEVHSTHSLADAVAKTDDAIYIFKFKLNVSSEEALKTN